MIHRITEIPDSQSTEEVKKHTVAFLDILGFKDKIERLDLSTFVAQYRHVLDQTEAFNRPLSTGDKSPRLFPSHPVGKPWCARHIFSDSIILISEDDSIESCLKLLVYAWRLIQVLLSFGLPVRGAITYGDLCVDLNRNLVMGLALTRAYDLERKQNWIGAVIDKTVFDAFPEFSIFPSDPNHVFDALFPEYDVPFKESPTSCMRTINWRFNMIVEKGTKSLFQMAGDEAVRQKVANTLEYAKAIVATKRIYCRDESTFPVELRVLWVGSNEPPFIHGDDL